MTPARYQTIVADPPWAYDDGWPVNRGRNAGSRIGLPYGAMSLDAIRALDVSAIATSDAHLLLWTTNRYVLDAYGVARAWGFRPSQLLTWCKPPVGIGPGGVFANTSEFCVYARRGKPEHLQRISSTWWEWPRGEHSAKPEAFLDLIEATFPGPYLEMFARRARFGWDYFGDESLGTAKLTPTSEEAA
jgi:N6-adenosine-specific RNA methylase IME4